MYTSITELPTQVTSSLDERDATTWMNAYNAVAKEGMDAHETALARRKAWETVRTAPSSFSFCTKASVEVVDKDKEIIDVPSINAHLDSFIEYGGNVIWEHGNYVVGCIWGWDPITEDGLPGVQVWGNLFGGDQVYDQARQNFVNGRNSLSVAGEADDGHYECDDRGCYTRRRVTQLLEISLCTVPANKHATMIWYNRNAKLTKSTDAPDIMLNVNTYEIHKDAQFCPIQAIKKSLLDSGYQRVHATPSGCEVELEPEDIAPAVVELGYMGYWATPVKKGVYVRDKEATVKNAYTALRKSGYIEGDGRLTSRIPYDVFKEYRDEGLIVNDGGVFRLTKFI